MNNTINALVNLKKTVDDLLQRLKIEAKTERVHDLEMEAGAPEFWNSPDEAQKIMQELSRLQAEIEPWNKVAQRVSDALELARMNDDSLIEELSLEVATPAEARAMLALKGGDRVGF